MSRLFTSSTLFSLGGIFLLGWGRPSSSLPFISPCAAAFGYLFILLGAIKNRSCKTGSFNSLLICLSLASAVQLSWLTSHPYMYMWCVWPTLAIVLAFPQAAIFSLFLKTARTFYQDSEKKNPSLHVHFRLGLYALTLALYEGVLPSMWPGISFFTSSLMLLWSDGAASIASYGGRDSLSFLIYWANFEGLMAISLYKTEMKRARHFFLAWIALSVLPYSASNFLSSPSGDTATSHINPFIVHMEETPDIFDIQHKTPWDVATYEWKKVVSTIAQSGGASLHSHDIIAIPEGAIPFPSDSLIVNLSEVRKTAPDILDHALVRTGLYLQDTQSFWGTSEETASIISNSLETPLLIGLEGREREGHTGEVKAFNSACYIAPSHGMMRYDKQLLIPFGEYIPFSWMQSILALYGVHGSFHAGSGSKVFQLQCKKTGEMIPFSPLICYEETFSTYGIDCRRNGARFIISVSNDNWFPSSRLSEEHFHLARLQAIELGIPIVRATNMGVSGIIDERGRVVISYTGSRIGDNRAISSPVSIPDSPHLTFYVRSYEMRNILALTAALFGWAFMIFRRSRSA